MVKLDGFAVLKNIHLLPCKSPTNLLQSPAVLETIVVFVE